MRKRVTLETKTQLIFDRVDIQGLVRQANPQLDTIRLEFAWADDEYHDDLFTVSWSTTEVISDER